MYAKRTPCTESLNMGKAADELREAFDSISPYIQRHTSEVCPSCPKVCCIDRHGRYEENDLVFIEALGLANLHCDPDRPDTDPCRFLSEKGCSLPRYRRPFRCTWYFCERLLESMHGDKPRDYREFMAAFENLQRLRRELPGLKGV